MSDWEHLRVLIIGGTCVGPVALELSVESLSKF